MRLVTRSNFDGLACAVGDSSLNRTCMVDVGSLMLKYGGGAHRQVGTCQFSDRWQSKLLLFCRKWIISTDKFTDVLKGTLQPKR